MGVLTGYDKIDSVIGEMNPGQLTFLAGAIGEGKTIFAANIAINVAVKQKKNVVIFTGEKTYANYMRLLYTCHSNNSKFDFPLSYKKVKWRTFTDIEEKQFNAVKEDITSGEYGYIGVCQVKLGTTMDEVEAYLEKIKNSCEFSIDLIIFDQATFFKPKSSQLYLGNSILSTEFFMSVKELALNFNGGVPILMLHSISKSARDKVKFEYGSFYTIDSLGFSMSSVQFADVVIAILRTEDMLESHELGVGIIKARDQYDSNILFKLNENFDTMFIGNGL